LGIFSLASAMIWQLPQSLIRALKAIAIYLFLTQLITLALKIKAIVDWLTSLTGNPLVVEIPDRLGGTRHIASIALLIIILFSAVNLAVERFKFSHWRTAALVIVEMAVLLSAICVHRKSLLAVIDSDCFFFIENDSHIERISISADNLDSLDPNQEETFFASLGDFLMIDAATTESTPESSSKRLNETEKK
jgi:hypothetical protein